MGTDESHFNVSLIVRDKVTRPCPQTTTFEEKGEPKRIRTEVPLRTSLTPYRWAKAAHVTSLMGHSLYTHFNASPSGILSPNSATIGNATNWTLYLHFICSSLYICNFFFYSAQRIIHNYRTRQYTCSNNG